VKGGSSKEARRDAEDRGQKAEDIMMMSTEIEQNIKLLCDALNRIESVRTCYSCQGHFWRGLPPYISFSADVSFAATLEKELRADSMAHAPRLQTLWEVVGRFGGEFELSFLLYSPGYHEKIGKPFCLAFREKALKQDFSVLKEIVEGLHDCLFGLDGQNHTPSRSENSHGQIQFLC
jgi:hypothetical protein